MKKFISIISVFFLFSGFAFSQSVQDGIKAMDNENYATAKKIFLAVTSQKPNDAEALYYAGKTCYILQQKDSAKIFFDKGIAANAKFASNYVGLGRFYLDQANAVDAKTNFDKATSLNAKDVKTLQLIGEAYANVPTKSNTDNKSAQDGITILEKALTFDKKNPTTYLILGDAYMSKWDGAGQAVTNYEYAAQYAQSTIAAQAYCRIGVLYAKAKNYNEALSGFQKSLAADSLYAPAHRELGELYYQSKQYTKARDSYKKYMSLADATIENQSRYASFLFLAKDYEATITMINNVIEKNPSNFILSRLIAYSYYEEGKYKDGLDYIEKFFKQVDSKKILASDYEYYGKLLTKNGNDSLAIINLNLCMSMDTSKAELHGDLAQIFYKKKKYADAAHEFELKMAKIKPNVQDYFQVGKCYYYAEQYTKSDSAFVKVTELSPNSQVGFLWRGRCNSNIDSTGAQQLAKPYYEKCIELASVDVTKNKKDIIESYKYLGWLSIQNNKDAEGIDYYKKVLELDPADEQAKSVVNDAKKINSSKSKS